MLQIKQGCVQISKHGKPPFENKAENSKTHGTGYDSLGKPDEVFMVCVYVGQLDVNEQQNLFKAHYSS